MIGKAAGPRLYLFLFAVEPQRYLGLLDFSTPQTEEEKTLAAEAKAEAERKAAEEEVRRTVPVQSSYSLPGSLGLLLLESCK